MTSSHTHAIYQLVTETGTSEVTSTGHQKAGKKSLLHCPVIRMGMVVCDFSIQDWKQEYELKEILCAIIGKTILETEVEEIHGSSQHQAYSSPRVWMILLPT